MSTDFVLGDQFARVLTETTQALVCVLDRRGHILFFNDACERATGFSRDEVLGTDARDSVIPPEEAPAFGEVLAYIWKTGLSSPQVGHWATKDGGRRLIAWSNKLMPGNGDAPTYLVTTGLDLSERALQGQERALGGDLEAKLAEVGRLAQEQRALRRVATLVASEATPEHVFKAVSEECARVLEVSTSAVFRYEGDDTATIVARFGDDDVPEFQVGSRLPVEGLTIGQVLATGTAARISDYGETSGETAKLMLNAGYRTTVSAPIVVAGILWGAVSVASGDPLSEDAEQRLSLFAELVSLAIASAQAREDLQRSRARIVKIGDEQRRRLERNLHDGAQQRLVSLALQLRLAKAQLATAPEATAETLNAASQELDLALAELREIARGLHPGALTEQGLGTALEALSSRLPLPIRIKAPAERLPADVEATGYYIVAETLTNVAKHARASAASVSIRREGNAVRFEITDDGRGGADPSSGTGLLGLRDRAEAAGGTLYVVSPPGKGTVVTATLPLGG